VSPARYIIGDVRDVLATLPDNSVDLVMSSPPFLALRSYLPADHPDKHREIGSESTPGEFIDTLVDIVEDLGRVLAPHGSLIFELGDTYAGTGGAGGDYGPVGLRAGQPALDGSAARTRSNRPAQYGTDTGPPRRTIMEGWPRAKSKVLIPELFAVTLAYGRNPLTGRETRPWQVRNVVHWCRPNPPIGALGKKFRPATSALTVACLDDDKRYFDLDAVRQPYKEPHRIGTALGHTKSPNYGEDVKSAWINTPGRIIEDRGGAPPLDYWVIPTQPYEGAHYACVDAETEALTRFGWKRHDQLADGDEIAAYNAGQGVITWQPATFHRYPFSGDLVAIEKRETSQRLTPNHRVLHRSARGFLRTRSAVEASPSWRLPVAAPFDVDGAGPGEDRAALLGWYVTEGSARRRTVDIYQSESANPKHCNRIRDLLDALRADYTEHRRVRPAGSSFSGRDSIEVRWAIRGELAGWLLGAAPDKRLPASVLGWSDNECAALLDALIDGDGHTRQSGRRQFIQKDRDTIDNVQALCCRLGLRSTISPRLDGSLSLTIGERSWLSLRGTNGIHEPIGREHYDGTVWCPSVPSTYWLARRNGRPFITGNTFPSELCVIPVKSMCPQRVCRECGKPSERITKVEYEALEDPVRNRAEPKASADYVRQQRQENAQGMAFGRATKSVETLGWTDCGHDNWRSGVVLDPFAGSGTTLAVATGHGRDAIGIDLDARNADLAIERVGPIFLTVENVAETPGVDS
jgi:hypothetical protein